MEQVHISIELPRDVLSAIKQDPESFVQEMRLTAVAKWYEMGIVSQAKAAEIAGVSRSGFLTALARFSVSPFQYGPDEIIKEATT